MENNLKNLNICKICGAKVSPKHFWTEHKIREACYYQTYFPKYDLFNGELINFKNLEFYLNNDFNSKENLYKWIQSNDKEKIKKYLSDLLINRKERKSILYSPSQIELRSLNIPGIIYFNNLFGNYYDLCNDLGFINKYENFIKWDEKIELNKRRKIFIDTREQKLLKFKNVKSETKTLNYADYIFSDDEWTGKIAIERKSLNDFIGTLSKGYERFIREIERAKKDNAYLIILVEENLSNSLDYKNKCNLNYNITIPPEYIFHNVRELIQKYDFIQFLFVDSHKVAASMVEKIFSFGKEIKKYDLQLLKDKEII